MVIQARETHHVAGTRIVPIGLIFERKDRPRSRIVAIVGDTGSTAVALPALPAPTQSMALNFPETGQSLGGRFLDFWQHNGGLAVFGRGAKQCAQVGCATEADHLAHE